MKTHYRCCLRLFLNAAVAGSCFTFVSVDKSHAQTPNSDAPAATHVVDPAMGTQPAAPAPDAAKGDPTLAQQLSQLQARVAQLEAALAKVAPPTTAPAAGATSAPPMAGSAGAAPAGGTNNMMAMMEKMMGMMDKMMSPAGGAPMPSGGSMPAPAAGMNGMSGGAGSVSQSSVPGVPGTSHLYHVGATGFFLDHPEHIALTPEQQAGLNKAKESALLAKSAADRAIEQAEQALWLLTAADQPDATQIEAKIREIQKLRGDQRLSYIRAVGDASKILTEEQRKSLTGLAPPAPANSTTAPPAAMPQGGMKKDM